MVNDKRDEGDVNVLVLDILVWYPPCSGDQACWASLNGEERNGTNKQSSWLFLRTRGEAAASVL